MNAKKILVIGANPAWQKTLFFNELRVGEVNRARETEEYAAGKGVNFCRAAFCFGKRGTKLFQFAGGATGERLRQALCTEGIDAVSVDTGKPTRCCITCIDKRTGQMTELIEPSTTVSQENAEIMLRKIAEHLPEAAGIAVTGTLPPGLGTAFYRNIAVLAEKVGVPLLIDAFAEITPLLAADCDKYLKINREELGKLSNIEKYPRLTIAITDGGNDAVLFHCGKRFILPPPDVGKTIVSPLGSGDTASAVFFSCLLDNIPPEKAFATALAAAGANCLNSRAGWFRMDDFERLSNCLDKKF